MGGAGAALDELRGDEDKVGGDEEGDGEAAEREGEVRPGEGEQDAHRGLRPVHEEEDWPECAHRVPDASVARWQNLISSFPWIAPRWRVWGRNPRKGRDPILQRSIAEP